MAQTEGLEPASGDRTRFMVLDEISSQTIPIWHLNHLITSACMK